jgi:hypothetical protein
MRLMRFLRRLAAFSAISIGVNRIHKATASIASLQLLGASVEGSLQTSQMYRQFSFR